jgi:hypothetical protein
MPSKIPYHNRYPQRGKALARQVRQEHRDHLGDVLHDGRAEQHPCSYFEYLQSKHWKIVRERALKLAGQVCSNCASRYNLCVHHLRYETLWREHDFDVVVLCDTCHNMLHGQLIYR